MLCFTEKVALAIFQMLNGSLYCRLYTSENLPRQYKSTVYCIFVAIDLGLICPRYLENKTVSAVLLDILYVFNGPLCLWLHFVKKKNVPFVIIFVLSSTKDSSSLCLSPLLSFVCKLLHFELITKYVYKIGGAISAWSCYEVFFAWKNPFTIWICGS